ncbi:MAG TPA: hypothetical protein VHA33_25255 [Candidatus Angelobacter sp.]|jgi:hypothetical protein|nr:hypothetical protein [Candidatus Angelobacter sp.]
MTLQANSIEGHKLNATARFELWEWVILVKIGAFDWIGQKMPPAMNAKMKD